MQRFSAAKRSFFLAGLYPEGSLTQNSKCVEHRGIAAFQGRVRDTEFRQGFSPVVDVPSGARKQTLHPGALHVRPGAASSDASYLLRLQRVDIVHEICDSLLHLAFMALTDARE